MEKDKKSVSIMPKEKMNELRMGEKGTSTTLNAIHNKISINQVKNVHSGYNKYWIYNGAIYGVKPGFIGRLDTGSTPSATNVYDVPGFSNLRWYQGYGGGDVGPNWTTLVRREHFYNINKHLITHPYFMYQNGTRDTNNMGRAEYAYPAFNVHINNMFLGQILALIYKNPKIAYACLVRSYENPYNGACAWDGRSGGYYCEFRRKTYNWRTGSIISWVRNWYAWHAEGNGADRNNYIRFYDGHTCLMNHIGF